MPALSIVIPTAGRRASLARVLAALERQSTRDCEVLVVADAQAGAVPEASVRATEPGASGARNAGWRAARSELVLFLDDDIVPERDLVHAHIAAHMADPAPERAVLGHVRWAAELRPTPLMAWLDEGIQFDYRSISGPEAAWYHLYSCNVSLKWSLLERAGGFDGGSFPFGYEDLDLGFRLGQLGLRLRYEPRAGAEHLNSPSVGEWVTRAARIAAAERAFVARYPQFPPYFHDRFSAVLDQPAPHGRLAPLARVLPRRFPVLGPRAWASATAVAERQIAAAYEEAWRSSHSAGSSPGGPK